MVSVATSTSMAEGPWLSTTVLTGCPHPCVVTALHVAALSTKTSLVTKKLPGGPGGLATYRVRVAGLRASATRNPPTLIVASGVPQPLITVALQRAPFTTVTVPVALAT